MLPATLKKANSDMFYDCGNLKTIWVEDGCPIDIKNYACIEHFPSGKIAVGGLLLRDLRRLRKVAIPEGVEKIGDRWFAGSWIESVEVPASVSEIGAGAFFSCERLARVVFKAV